MNSENLNVEHNRSEEISLKELIVKLGEWWRYLLSKWLKILVFGLLGGALGYTYAFFKKSEYVAVTTFVIDDGNNGAGGLGSLSGLASMAGLDLNGGGGSIFQGDNILELYKSRTMIQKTLLTEVSYMGKKQLLIDRYLDFNGVREKWDKVPELKQIQFKTPSMNRLQDSILGAVVADINKNYLDVSKLDKKLSIIKAQVSSSDEFFSKTFNNEIVRNVNDFYIQTKTKKSSENVAILQKKTDSVRSVMNGAIYSAVAVSDATPNLNPTREVQRVAPMQRSQFNAETNKAVLGELVKNLELSRMSLLKETPLIQVVDEPVFPLAKRKLSKLIALIFGGILGGFAACLVLITRRFLKMTLA